MSRSGVVRLSDGGSNIGATSSLGTTQRWRHSGAAQEATGPLGSIHLDPIAFDPVEALLAMPDQSPAADSAATGGLASQLLDYVMPRPRNFGTLQPQRIAPLLGLAARLLADQAASNNDLAHLGAAAIEHELRRHQALAERRAGAELDAEQTAV